MSLQTDYALRLLMYLAIHDPEARTVHDVAQSYGISRNHLLKIVPRLRDMGLLVTTRGRTGGIRLAVAPRHVNIGVVVRNLGDENPMLDCMKPDGGVCVLSPICRLKGLVRDALGAYLAVFDNYTLADLVMNRMELADVLGAYKLIDHPKDQAA